MFRPFLIITLILLTGFLFLQNHKINKLTVKLDETGEAFHKLKINLAKKEAADALLQKFIIANHKKIQSLTPKRTLTVTAYSPRIRETDGTPYNTASNRRVREGIVAVSRDLFDNGWVFGKKVYIKQLGVFTIDDLMSGEKKNQLDIFMSDTKAALKFGKRKMEAYLLDMDVIKKVQEES